MATINFYKIFALLYMGFASLFSCNHNDITSDKVATTIEENNEALIGKWVYTQQICAIKSKIPENKFFLTIDGTSIYLAGNQVECNECYKDYKVSEDKIVFPDIHSSPICTELECMDEYWYCNEDETILTYIFKDMNFEIEGDVLTLSRGNASLTLTRVK